MIDKVIELLERFYLNSEYLSQLDFLGNNKRPINIFNFLSDYIKYLGNYYLEWSGGNRNFDIDYDSIAVSDYYHQRKIEEIPFSRTYFYLISSDYSYVEIPESYGKNSDEFDKQPRLFEICNPLVLYGTKKNYSRYFILDLINYFLHDKKHKEAFDKMYSDLSKSIPIYCATSSRLSTSPEDNKLFNNLEDLKNYFSNKDPELLYIREYYITL